MTANWQPLSGSCGILSRPVEAPLVHSVDNLSRPPPRPSFSMHGRLKWRLQVCHCKILKELILHLVVSLGFTDLTGGCNEYPGKYTL